MRRGKPRIFLWPRMKKMKVNTSFSFDFAEIMFCTSQNYKGINSYIMDRNKILDIQLSSEFRVH